MNPLTMFGKPDEFPFLLYFFPAVSTGYLYWQHQTGDYLFLLLLVSLVVVLMESYHQAFKMVSPPAENVKLITPLDIRNPAILKFAKENMPFLFFDLAWYLSFVLTCVVLFINRADAGTLLLLTGQVGLFLFVHLQAFFFSKLYAKRAAATPPKSNTINPEEVLKIVQDVAKSFNKNK